MARYLPEGPALEVLDLATGTADQVLLLCDACDRIRHAVGMDLSENMLAVGRRKVAARGYADRIELLPGDAMSIPAPDRSFDAVTISYGIRNVTDVVASLRDMLRVLRPGGRVLILEGSLPANPLIRFGHLGYLRYVMPVLGGLISGDLRAYQYLNRTIESFPCGEAFRALLRQAGFVNVEALPVTLGVSTIYRGDRPPEDEA
jgi:demethylmenaquinone methyltransferase/2-methoxy-6-polyprenyl-1,4-benzoquinol methylase